MKSYLIFFGSFRSSSNANVYLSVWVSACVRFLVQIFLRFLQLSLSIQCQTDRDHKNFVLFWHISVQRRIKQRLTELFEVFIIYIEEYTFPRMHHDAEFLTERQKIIGDLQVHDHRKNE